MRLLKFFLPNSKSGISNSYDILIGVLWVALFTFLSKIFGALKEMSIAYKYGISSEVDAYLFILNLVSWPIGLWSSIITVVLVPVITSLKISSFEKVSNFCSELLGFSILLGSVFWITTWVTLEVIVNSGQVGLPFATLRLAEAMIPGLALIVPLGFLISLLSVFVISNGHQINTIFEGSPALVLFLFVLISPVANVSTLILGTFYGYVVNLLLLLFYFGNQKWIFKPVFIRKSPSWSIFSSGVGVLVVGQILMSLVTIVDQFYAAGLDEGSISILSYANRILSLILGMGAIAITRATLPVFSKALIENKSEGLYSLAFYWAKVFFILGSLGSLGIYFFSESIVRLIFERGAFTTTNTKAVVSVFNLLLIQTPFYFSGIVLVSLLASQRRYRLIALSGILNLLVKLLANMYFIPIFGLNGVAISTDVVYFIALILLTIFNSKFFREKLYS